MLRPHVPERLREIEQTPRVRQARRRIGLPETRENRADPAQARYIFGTHAEGHAALGSKQVGQYGHVGAARALKEQRRASGMQRRVSKCRDLELWRDRDGNPEKIAVALQPLQEFPQVTISHFSLLNV
jgi:hypothetical protein